MVKKMKLYALAYQAKEGSHQKTVTSGQSPVGSQQ
jgi:hypothetical protein